MLVLSSTVRSMPLALALASALVPVLVSVLLLLLIRELVLVPVLVPVSGPVLVTMDLNGQTTSFDAHSLFCHLFASRSLDLTISLIA